MLADPKEQKWRRLRLANARFQRLVAPHAHAMALLDAAGFELVRSQETGLQDALVLTRDDPALVWAAISALQKWRQILL